VLLLTYCKHLGQLPPLVYSLTVIQLSATLVTRLANLLFPVIHQILPPALVNLVTHAGQAARSWLPCPARWIDPALFVENQEVSPAHWRKRVSLGFSCDKAKLYQF